MRNLNKIEILEYFTTNYEQFSKQEIEILKKVNQTAENNLEECLYKYYTPDDSSNIENLLMKIKRCL